MEEFDEEDIDLSEESPDAVEIQSPAGASIVVMNQREADYYLQIAGRYQKDNLFQNISDLLELDRILLMELMSYRWGCWLLEETDYDNQPVDLEGLQKSIESYSKEIRLIKKSLGIDKSTRDKEHGESAAEYLANLRLRAKEFGFMRNEQAVAAITLWKELEGLITLHKNSTQEERNEFRANATDVIDWIDAKIPEFNDIDKKFRKTKQTYWIRSV